MMTSNSYPRLPLQDLALAPTSLASYTRQLQSFLRYSRLSRPLFRTMPAPQMDHLLSVYLQHLFDTADPDAQQRRSGFSYASLAVHAVVYHRPELRSLLPTARQCLNGYEHMRATQSHPPLTWELTVVFACLMSNSGYHAQAVGTLLAFDCYLRVGELTRLRRRDIVMPNDPRMGRAAPGMAICLYRTKTGLNQSVTLQNPDVAQLLVRWVDSLHLPPHSSARVFDFDVSSLRRLMRNASILLGLGATPYVPHSLRHGGATHDFLMGRGIAHVQFRGRWQSMESSRRYIQTTRALLAQHEVPQHLHDVGTILSDSLLDVLQHSFDTVAPRARRVRRVSFI